MRNKKKTCCRNNKSSNFEQKLLYKYTMKNLCSQILEEIENFKMELQRG